MENENQGTNNAANTGATNNTGVVTQPTTNTQKTEGTVTQPVNKTEAKPSEKTFTQEEVNAIMAKERNKMPSEDELKAFNEWKESQKTAEEKQKEELIRVQNLESDRNSQSQIIEIMKKGVDYDTAEFIQFKLNKMDGDFETNLETYLANNKLTNKEEKKITTTGFSQGQSNNAVVDEGKAYLDKKYANNPYYKK